MPKSITPEQRVVAHLFKKMGVRASGAQWGQEVAMAKKIMQPPSDIPDELGVSIGYTAEEVMACIDAMYEKGTKIWSLKFFIASPKHLSDYVANSEKFDPDTVYTGRSREEEISVRIRRASNF